MFVNWLKHNIQGTSLYHASRASEYSLESANDYRLLGLSGLVIDMIIQTGETQWLEIGDDGVFASIKAIREAFEMRKRYMNWRAVAGLPSEKSMAPEKTWKTLTNRY